MSDLKNPASNTVECFLTFRGQQLVGVLGNVWPLQSTGDGTENTTLVFEDGRGLTINSNGSHWVSSRENVANAINSLRQNLEKARANLDSMEAMAEMLEPRPRTPTAK